jgi:hypothetical protein
MFGSIGMPQLPRLIWRVGPTRRERASGFSGTQMLRTELLLGVTLSVLSSCGGSAPTAPEDTATNLVGIGPQVLPIVYQSPCTQLGQGVLPLVYTRVSVAVNSNEWVAGGQRCCRRHSGSLSSVF